MFIQEQKYAINLPKINITNLEAKVSFTDGVFNPPKKLPCKYLFKTLLNGYYLKKFIILLNLFNNTTCGLQL